MADAGLQGRLLAGLYAYNTDPNPRIAQAIQQDLAAVGIKAEIKSLDQANVIAAGGNKDQRAADLVGRHGLDRRLPGSARTSTGRSWAAAAPSRAAGTGRGTATRTSRIGRPRPTPWSPKQREARARSVAEIFNNIMTEDAPWVPVFNERRIVASPSVWAGPIRLFDPTRVINYEAIYATE